jgi:hypothetical protein
MNLLWLPLLTSFLTSPISPTIPISFGEEMDPYAFRLPIDVVLPYTQAIESRVLGQSTLDILHDTNLYTYTIQVTMAESIVRPLTGISPFISQFSFQTDQMYVDVFNPTRTIVDLSLFSIQVNDQSFAFASTLSLSPLNTQRILILRKAVSRLTIDSTYEVWLDATTPMTSIEFNKLNQETFTDQIPIQTDMDTRYGLFAIQEWRFIRSNKTTGPELTYQTNSWVARPHGTIETAHELMSPVVTPLEQATAWATYVMYGAGMFALGRVEEAFEALRSEYEFMDGMSQRLLFSQPSTTITGINEQGKMSQSTFREAIGRYNYLAARVPGAIGLSMPSADTFPWLSVLYASLLVMGFVGVIVVLKTRKKQT